MNRIAILAFALITFMVSCNQKQQTTEEQTATEETHKTPEPQGVQVKLADLATNKDLYCGMELEEGYITDTASYEGKLYGFCATECKAEFLKDPQQYLATK